ncbi:hypothetical protein [Ignicoccus hospitalis]|uniref:Uncharacterized protein n=1 Tax=Ignicoccus hospitalis (strain KIN4/I / DSM 18386 / JCM 14125) TaxID=453591 RepID=A8AA57_IGNH4|nr:hypothetical protein [Ignicoccus hospitalis]ABU81809.1 hypothetical protein Igni_0627 [Ignicoccus hospitalis KIN4/I]HIH90078.1 hypothetical protein [Desulfurococcaceae archaeon]
MRRALALLAFATLALAITNDTIKLGYRDLVDYFVGAQRPCGGFFDCEPNYYRSDALIAYYLAPEDPLTLDAAEVFVKNVFLKEYDLWYLMDPNNKIYTWWPLFNALALLSSNISDDLVVAVENIISKNFGPRGLRTCLPLYYQNYFGWVPYDLMSTLLALAIAKKSEIVDKNLDFQKLNSTLEPNFWNVLKKYLRGEINARLRKDYVVAWLSLLAMGQGAKLRAEVCGILNQTYFKKVYYSYTNLTPVDFDAQATSLLIDASLTCSAFGHLNSTYARKVAEWLLESYIIRNGGEWPRRFEALSALRTLMGFPSLNFELVSTEKWPQREIEEQLQNSTQSATVPTIIETKTVHETVTLSSSTTKTIEVGLPFGGLLGLLPFGVRRLSSRRKRGPSCSGRPSPK